MKLVSRLIPTIILVAFLVYCIITKPENLLRDCAITIFSVVVWSYIVQIVCLIVMLFLKRIQDKSTFLGLVLPLGFIFLAVEKYKQLN